MQPNLSGDRHGVTFERPRDRKRLDGQALRVFELMKDGVWRTLAQIAAGAGCPEASASARLRDLRRPEFGGFIVEREYIDHGLWKYKLIIPRREPFQESFGF